MSGGKNRYATLYLSDCIKIGKNIKESTEHQNIKNLKQMNIFSEDLKREIIKKPFTKYDQTFLLNRIRESGDKN